MMNEKQRGLDRMKPYGIGMGRKRNVMVGSIGLQEFRPFRSFLGAECMFRQTNHPVFHLQYQGYGNFGSVWWCRENGKTYYNNWIYGLIQIDRNKITNKR